MKEFNLSSLDELIESTKNKEKYDMESKKMKEFSVIIKGVTKKYCFSGNRLLWMDADDLEQDLWERVLILIDDMGGIDNPDLTGKLVADVCWKRAVDKYRYNRRRYDSRVQFIEGSDADSEDTEDYFDSLRSGDLYTKGIDLVFYKEVIDLFPVGSKERKYVVMKLVNNGLVDIDRLDPHDREIAEIIESDNIREKETDYIYALGYTSHCPGHWTKTKNHMRVTIHEFLSY